MSDADMTKIIISSQSDEFYLCGGLIRENPLRTYFNVLGLLGVYIQGFICDSAKSFVKVLSFVDFGHVCYLSHPICFGVPDFSRGRCYATMYDSQFNSASKLLPAVLSKSIVSHSALKIKT